MLTLNLGWESFSLRTILCLGAHCDDIEIGCGGTILRLVAEYPDTEVYWVVFSSNTTRAAEARVSADRFLKGVRKKKVLTEEFRNGFFPYIGSSIKEYFEKLKDTMVPDIIFTHYHNDFHQDHRLISELTWNTFRNHLILEYEIAKYDGDLGSPNLFVPLMKAVCTKKINYILECFETQQEKHWFTDETFYSTLRLRGIESNSSSGYAEAFYGRKAVIGINESICLL